MPFGVKIAQDVFQCRLDEIFKDIPNVAGIAGDILVCGSSDIEHDLSFINMLGACRLNNVALNSGKLQFKQKKINFYGHTLREEGLQPAEDKLQATTNIKVPENTAELLTILGMINYLNRFSVKLADYTATLRELTKKHVRLTVKQHLTRSRKNSVHPESYPTMIPIQPHLQFCSVMPVRLDLEHGSDKKVTVLKR